jgi:hypothetical protein
VLAKYQDALNRSDTDAVMELNAAAVNYEAGGTQGSQDRELWFGMRFLQVSARRKDLKQTPLFVYLARVQK